MLAFRGWPRLLGLERARGGWIRASTRIMAFFSFYRKYGGGNDESYYSRGNLKRLREWVETVDGDLLTVGLFIPFETAWKAVKEFIERDGALPRSIDWIAERDVPSYACPPGSRDTAEG
jgi:hypothetical protein